MKYQGSKNRIAKELYQAMLPYINKERTAWFEPFVGGANMIDKIPDKFYKLGTDNNEYIIALFNAIIKGWIPPNVISEEEYQDVKNNKEKYEKHFVGFVGIGCSFAGKWFGGYARGGTRNYCAESKRNLLKQKDKIKNVKFIAIDYKSIPFEIEYNKIILYCDPPYQNTTKYHSNFNYEQFWEWCKDKVQKGCLVFVSEYQEPQEWKCIWQKEIISNLDLDTGKKRNIEKLFIFNHLE